MPTREYRFHCFGSSFSVYTEKERDYFIQAFGFAGNRFTLETINLLTKQ